MTTEPQPSTSGSDLIAAERQRQIDAEGWTPEHDDEHDRAQMTYAAATYLMCTPPVGAYAKLYWPWDMEWFKPSPDRIRNLVKAGALIAAEIDRLQRKANV